VKSRNGVCLVWSSHWSLASVSSQHSVVSPRPCLIVGGIFIRTASCRESVRRLAWSASVKIAKILHKATHGQGEADPSTVTGGSKHCVTK